MASILDSIIGYKADEVSRAKQARPYASLDAQARGAGHTRGFAKALRAEAASGRPALIAEVKKASPSKGVIRAGFDPASLAMAYERGGAACLSVLTDGPSFQGSADALIAARGACSIPVLRKDFMIDPYQVAESRAMGADCILIIMACTADVLVAELFAAASDFGMDALFEVHDRAELDRALKLGAGMIGINNRNLKTFETRLETTEELIADIPREKLSVTESGIRSNADVVRLMKSGAHAFLVGESLMRCADVEKATKDLLAPQAAGLA